MRNVFDQYRYPENQLTHALATCLAEDQSLLRAFVAKFAGSSPPSRSRLLVSEQSLPGEREQDEEEAERRGLPDLCITDGNDWSFLIESKITARATTDQLRRHINTVRRRIGGDPQLLLITAVPAGVHLPAGCSSAQWAEIYRWLKRQPTRCDWAGRAASFFESLEARMIENGDLKKGALTVFTGFPFGTDQPYIYGQAKRVLGQAMEELRERRTLVKLGMDRASKSRSAITGTEGESVWDFLPLSAARGAKQFTLFPHLTLSVERTRVLAHVTIPYRIGPPLRGRIRAWSLETFHEILLEVEQKMRPIVRAAPGATPMYVGLQRHYRSQRSEGIIDGQLQFDLRVLVNTGTRRRGTPKAQPSFVDAAYSALKNRGPNFQMAVGLALPYRECRAVREPRALDLIAEAWIACKPLLDAVMRS